MMKIPFQLGLPGRRIVALTSLLLCFLATSSRAGEPRAWFVMEQQVASAKAALQLAESQRAESDYRQALAQGWTLLGQLAVADGDLLAAEAAFERAATAAPSQAVEARLALAATRTKLGEFPEALSELRLLIHSESKNGRIRRQLIRALALAGSFEEAAAELAEWRRVEPAPAEQLATTIEAARAEPERTAEILGPETEDGPFKEVNAEERDALRSRVELEVAEIDRALATLADQTSLDVALSSAKARSQMKAAEAAVSQSEAELLADLESDDKLSDDKLSDDKLSDDKLSGHKLEARQALARFYLLADRLDDAATQLRQAAELGPLERDLSFLLAEIETRDGRFPASNHQLRSLVERFDSAAAETCLAHNAAKRGNFKTAAEYARQARDSAPTSESALRLFATLGLEAGLASAVASSVETLERMQPDEPFYAYLAGRVFLGLGDTSEASQALLRAHDLDPDDLPIRRALGLALAQEARYEEARQHLESYASSHQDDYEVEATLAEAELRLGEIDAAAQRAQRVLEVVPAQPTANLVVGMLRSREGRFAEARAALETAVASDPGLARAHYQLSFACSRLGDEACAEKHLALSKRTAKGSEIEMKSGGEQQPTLMKKSEPAPSPLRSPGGPSPASKGGEGK